MRTTLVIAVGLLAALAHPQQTNQRLGLSADRIVAMGLPGWERYYNSRVEPSGLTRGVAYGVYVGAMREQNERLFRDLPAAHRARLRSVSALTKGYSDTLGNLQWTFEGGNAYDPEGDTVELARAEARMLRSALRGTRQPASTVAKVETSISRAQARLEADLKDRIQRAQIFYGAPSRPRNQVAAELRAKPRELRNVYSRLRRQLASETTGVRFEVLTAIRDLTLSGNR